MVKNFTLLILLFSCLACAPKVYFFQANKLGAEDSIDNTNPEIDTEIYFAGDALDYVIFELDVINNSPDSVFVTSRDIQLEVYDKRNRPPVILNTLSKDEIIWSLQDAHKRLQSEKKARDIGNAIGIGLDLLVIGSSGGMNSTQAIFYSVDAASYMLEDARAHKLMTGELEDQIDYVEEWVLGETVLAPGEKGSWDILFPRQLYEAPAIVVWEGNRHIYKQDFELYIKEERVR